MVLYKAIAGLMLSSILATSTPQDLIRTPELEWERVTCYTWTGNKTATGIYPHEGICASSRDHIGQMAMIYNADMELIGMYECLDTGGARRLRVDGEVDIYFDTLERCREWINENGDYCYVCWIEAEG